MSETEKAKIGHFMRDDILNSAVYDVLMKAFTKPIPHEDTNVLAASRIAIDLLQTGWRDLEKFKNETPSEKKPLVQVGY